MPESSDFYAQASIESSGGRTLALRAGDGTALRAARWEAEGEAQGTALYLNGRTEFIEKNLETVAELRQRGFRVFHLDWRGQGLSDRPLADRQKGHVEDYALYLSDLDLLLDDQILPAGQAPLVLLGHSMGGHIGLRLLHDRPDLFAAAAFSAPMVDIGASRFNSLGVRATGALGALPWLKTRYLPGSGDYGPAARCFENNPLTSDPGRFQVMHRQIDRNPDLALGGATWGWLHASQVSIARLRDPAYGRVIVTPTLICSASLDSVVSNRAQAELAARLPRGELAVVEGSQHEVLIEREPLRQQFWALFDRLRAEALPQA